MTNVIRIKRRAAGGAAGAPATLANAELAYNETEDILYYGKGTGGAGGTATSAEPVGGRGAVVTKTGDQTVGGKKTFTTSPEAPTPLAGDDSTKLATTEYVQRELQDFGAGDMLKEDYDSNDDGKVDAADVADAVPWAGVQDKPDVFPPSAHTHDDRYYTETEVNGLLAAKASLVSPAFTGTPTAPTPATGNSSTQVATTAFVLAQIEELIGSAPELLNTFAEIAAALGDDPDFAATITAALGGKAAKAANLSDLADVAQARSNLGLGTLAQQNANAVAITGGTIDNIELDAGAY